MAVNGLGAWRQKQENKGGKFLKLKDKEAVNIRFLNELSEDSENFLTEAGTANFVTEFVDPKDFRKTFVDTTETDGACLGFELANKYGWKRPDEEEDPEGHANWQDWRPKQRMYVNVLVDDGNEERVAVLQLSLGPKAVVSNALIELSDDSGSITNRWFKYSRKGTGQFDTTYTLTPRDKDDDLPPATNYELHDLTEVVKYVPYEQQAAYVGLSTVAQGSSSSSSEAAEPSATSVDW